MDGDVPLVLGGDARADSPGHTAKLGSNTLMELNTDRIFNIELIQDFLKLRYKMLKFYSLDLKRLLLAALHYNENGDREQAVTESGDKAFTISFPRAKSGDYVVRKRSLAATFESDKGIIEKEMDKLVTLGILGVGHSSYTSPVLLVPKKVTEDSPQESSRPIPPESGVQNLEQPSPVSVDIQETDSNARKESNQSGVSHFSNLPVLPPVDTQSNNLPEPRLADRMQVPHDHREVPPELYSPPRPLIAKIKNLVTRHIPKQAELDKLMNVIKKKIIRDFNLPVDVNELRKEQESSAFFKPVYNYLAHDILPNDRKSAKSVQLKSEQYILCNGILFRLFFCEKKANSKRIAAEWCGPLVIHKVLDRTHYILSTIKGEILNDVFNFNRLKPRFIRSSSDIKNITKVQKLKAALGQERRPQPNDIGLETESLQFIDENDTVLPCVSSTDIECVDKLESVDPNQYTKHTSENQGLGIPSPVNREQLEQQLSLILAAPKEPFMNIEKTRFKSGHLQILLSFGRSPNCDKGKEFRFWWSVDKYADSEDLVKQILENTKITKFGNPRRMFKDLYV
ncbi:hypothetical protein HOLleu_00790 [Holothuria leucospilota]|uniref:Uncharacterized protein n=1 Tax=Holothuria leucospilota TaxID=206669 RepID=A0A9Q1HIW3_HOLLE|nr:hypothetical protein HOLleu_00790 [Holothuria leucospilota]